MYKTYKCLICNSILKVEFNNGKSIKREFFDEYSIIKANTYLWGGSECMPCPLLMTNEQSGFEKLMQEGKVAEIE
mgnify:CR=1 FL=1